MREKEKKMFYFFVGCVSLAVIIIGATYAYFMASVSDEDSVYGDADTVSFGLSVTKVTSVDMAYGLIPMYNNRSSYAAEKKCLDDLNNAVCQIYKISIRADSDTVMFLDGYVSITAIEGLETRFTNVYTEDEEESFHTTNYTSDDFLRDDFNESDVIKSGVKRSLNDETFNHAEDFDCLLIENDQIGGESGRDKVYYMMIWVYDNGKSQDYLQGMQLAYQGKVTFVTAEGNEISATFD